MKDGGRINILSVDDHEVVREGIAALLSNEADTAVVAEASNGHEAIEQFRNHRPDITLMDLQMPIMNGAEAITAIRKGFPNARIIVLTTYRGDAQAVRAKLALRDIFSKACFARNWLRQFGLFIVVERKSPR